jgi:hypothetical protein
MLTIEEILNLVYDEETKTLRTTTGTGDGIEAETIQEILNAVFDPETNSLRVI